MKIVSLFVTLWAIVDTGASVSSKMDFGEDTSYTVTNSTAVEDDEDLEVKHVITVETSLKNSNTRRGLRGPHIDFQRKGSPKQKKERNQEDSGEVPVVLGWKAVETTAIQTPDKRVKEPESVFINRNIRDEYDVYPNVAYSNPAQWTPSVYYNNINWWNQQNMRDPGFSRRIDRPESIDPVKLSKKLSDDTMREFYCKRCAELNGMKSCSQRKIQTTTPKMKIDGKLAKLN